MEAANSPEEFKLGMKSEKWVMGEEGMIGPEIMIHENSIESEVLTSAEERVSDLSEGDPIDKMIKFNGGALNSSEKQKKDTYIVAQGLSQVDPNQGKNK